MCPLPEASMSFRTMVIAAALAVLIAAPIGARDLKPAAAAAFDRYIRLTEARMDNEVAGRSPFLWIDRQPENERALLRRRLSSGEIVSDRLETRDGNRRIEIDDALLHHWVGTVLHPGVTLDRVIAFVQDYSRYPERFAPLIQRAEVLSHTDDHFNVAMRTWTKKVIVVVIDAEYPVDYRRLSPTRVHARSAARNIFHVEDPGKPTEKRIPGDQSSGFLWRFNNYCSFETVPEGVYEQCEAISLTRDAPFGLGLIIRPFITNIPRDTLAFTLGAVRKGVTGK
jgi:hypothetical protein